MSGKCTLIRGFKKKSWDVEITDNKRYHLKLLAVLANPRDPKRPTSTLFWRTQLHHIFFNG